MPQHPVIAIAGLACEISTFSPARTDAAAFHPRQGQEIIQKYTFLQPGTALGDKATWKGVLIGHALPSGVVARAAFEELADEILTRLAQLCESNPIDGLWFYIQGAMCVEGLDDAEAELLGRIRQVIGPQVIVSGSMDLHGNVSQRLAHQTDLITGYRTAPHEDVTDTKQRACRNLVAILTSEGGMKSRPLKAWSRIPILLPGEQTSTRVEPAKALSQLVPEIEATPGVLDAAIWKLAAHFWDAREAFQFVAPTGTLVEGIDVALRSDRRTLFISNSGEPRSTEIVIVKIGYLEPELYEMAAEWRLALTPGGVEQDLARLPHARTHRPMWPFDQSFDERPDLTPRLVPSSHEQFVV